MKKILLLFFFLISITIVKAQAPGTIDRSYAANGFQLINIADSAHDLFSYMASKILPSGDYFVSGTHPTFVNDGNREILIKFKSNGEGDSSFARTGFRKFGAHTANGFDLYNQVIAYQQVAEKVILFSLASTTDIVTMHRLKMNGNYDSAFGTTGVRYTTVKDFNNQYTNIGYYFFQTQPDDKILVGGTVKVNSANERIFLYRLKANGEADSTFGTFGIREYLVNSFNNLKFISSAKNDSLFMCVYNSGAINLLKLDQNGNIDNSFGTGGVAIAIPTFGGPPSLNQIRLIQLNSNKIWMMHVSEGNGPTDIYMFNPDGTPDLSFNGNGVYRTNFFNFRITRLLNVAKLGDGEIRALVGNFTQPANSLTFMRINENGIIDSAFGDNGLYTMNISVNGYKGIYGGWVTRPDSTRIMAFGHLASSNGTIPEKAHALMIKPNGPVDSTYSNNGSAVYTVFAGQDYLSDVESLGTGKLLYLGYDMFKTKLYLGRLDSFGKRDPSFGNNGIKIIAPAPTVSGTIIKRRSLLNGPFDTAQMVISYSTGLSSFVVHKFKNNGNYDSSFGTNGQVTVVVSKPVFTIPKAIFLPGGKMLVLMGSVSSPTNESADILIIRLNTDGLKDAGFGSNGIVTIDQNLFFCTATCVGSRDFAKDIIYTSDGKILVTGSLIAGTGNEFSCMFRLNSNGSKDVSFGTNGKVTFFLSAWQIKTTALSEQENQKYVLTFNQYNPTTGVKTSNINRYNYNGSLDNSFTPTTIPNPTPGGQHAIQSIDVQADKKINLVCVSDPSYSGKPYIARVNQLGTMDMSFGTNGIFILDTLKVLPATDVEYGNFTYFKKDIQGRLIFGTVGELFQLRDALFTRVLTGDSPVVLAAPANDDCSNAQDIIINNSPLVSQSTETATQSLAPVLCTTTSPTANDVWYKFNATTTFAYIITSNSSNYDAVIEVFSSCGGPSLKCGNNTGNGIPDTVRLTGLTAGNTYYFRVYEDGNGAPLGSTFSVKVEAILTNFSRHIVKLKNKGSSPYTLANPLAYLSQRAIDRRTRYGIAIDSTDMPVTPIYIQQIQNLPTVTVLNTSKWLNSVTIQTSDAHAIAAINSFAFVQSVGNIAAKVTGNNPPGRNKFDLETQGLPSQQRIERITADYFNYGGNSYTEIHLHNGEFLHNIGLRGQTMVITILDGGFFNYNTLDAMDSIITNNQVLSTWDFVARHASVSEDDPHGMQCLSTIAANIPGQFVGKAPKASFHLFRTEETSTEYPIEEFNWVCGAERADSAGSDIISSSLGYSSQMSHPSFDHTYAEMNGNTTIAATGADLGAKKGMLIFNSIGNEGTGSFHFLSTPSDGDSVVAVGAVNNTGVLWPGTSYGPSSDGQIKPDLASVGQNAVIQNTNNTIGAGTGTSFASPNMAGLGTCLWQGFPEFNNMKILKALQQSGSKASTPDDRVGYGIPDMKMAFAGLLTDFATSSATVNACNAILNWTSKDVSAMLYVIERKLPGEAAYTPIAQVSPAAGLILANHSYQFNNIIISPIAGAVSYRIGQIIDTAVASFMIVYIDTANVTITGGCFATGTGNVDPGKVAVTLQPNPVSGTTVSLIIETPYAVTYMPVGVYDNKGRLVMLVNSSKATGKKTMELNIERLAKGKYYIKVLNGVKTIGTAELLKL